MIGLFQFEVTANYPIVWNEHQEWRVDFTACKAVVYLIFAHKEFFKGKSNILFCTLVTDHV